MKTRYTLLAIVGMLALSAHSLLAQDRATATGTVNTTMLKPIFLTWDHALDFGTFTQPTLASTLVMDVSGAPAITTDNAASNGSSMTPSIGSGDITLVNTPQTGISTGNPGPSTFKVSGAPSFVYAITLPPGTIPVNPVVTLYGPGGTNPMALSNFQANVNGSIATGGTLNVNGVSYFSVGATLNVNANQPTGPYTGQFGVQVNYN